MDPLYLDQPPVDSLYLGQPRGLPLHFTDYRLPITDYRLPTINQRSGDVPVQFYRVLVEQ